MVEKELHSKFAEERVDVQKLLANIAGESVQQLLHVLPQLKSPQAFDEQIWQAIGAFTVYLGKGEEDAIDLLRKENQRLNTETRRLGEEKASLERALQNKETTIASLQHQNQMLIRRD